MLIHFLHGILANNQLMFLAHVLAPQGIMLASCIVMLEERKSEIEDGTVHTYTK